MCLEIIWFSQYIKAEETSEDRGPKTDAYLVGLGVSATQTAWQKHKNNKDQRKNREVLMHIFYI